MSSRNHRFDAHQDKVLIAVLLKHGKRWQQIQQAYFPELKAKQLQNRYGYLTSNGRNSDIARRVEVAHKGFSFIDCVKVVRDVRDDDQGEFCIDVI